MRAVIQRVIKAAVTIEMETFSTIDKGLLILIGIEDSDNDEDIEWLAEKISKIRLFNDENGVMNYSAIEANCQLMVVSQFTLHASTKKGNRPSYKRAAKALFACEMYQKFVVRLSLISGLQVATGIFAADMKVNLVNDGPVTIIIDTKNKE
jgi:D-aminoacyl-tRNA deacylase